MPEGSCGRYRIHLELKTTQARLLRLVGKYRKYCQAQLRKTKSEGVWIELLTGRVEGKKELRLFHADIMSQASRPIPKRSRKIAFSTVQEVIDRLGGDAKLNGDAMSIFILEKSKYRLKGGLKLPMSFSMEEKLARRVGDATLQGLELGFEKSPIGLQYAEMSVQGDELWLAIQTGFYSSSVERVLRDTFNQTRMIGALFVEEGYPREPTN